jgi:hypothetical protein
MNECSYWGCWNDHLTSPKMKDKLGFKNQNPPKAGKSGQKWLN